LASEADNPVMRVIGGRGHFRSRDKDGRHTTRSATAEKSHVARKFSIPDVLPIKVLHCGYEESRGPRCMYVYSMYKCT